MLFKYKARTATGLINAGTREAASEASAITWMREQGWSPIHVEAVSSGGGTLFGGGAKGSSILSGELFPQKVTLKDKNVLFKQMATMVNAGITIAGTMELLSAQIENKTLGRAVAEIRDAVSSGVTTAAAFARHPKIFSSLEVALIRAGEEGGVLDVSLARLASFVEAQYSLQKKIKGAMMYPSVVMVFTLLVLVGLCVGIVPMFRKAFANIGIEKTPLLTSIVFGISDVLVAYWFLIPVPFILIYAGLKYFNKTEEGKKILDKVKLRAPLFGDIIFKSILARAFRTLATLVTAGVSILDAIEMSAGVADNFVIGEAFKTMKERAQNGVMLSVTIKEQKLFPAMVAHMVAVGEETGQVDDVLSKVADWYDVELDEKIKGLTSILEPVMIIFVGLVVGLVVASVFIPIIQAMQQFM
ncbi:MAG: type II secretion system F family protein [Synergistaceae bacterium]|jgi:type IV pilus assembly protein PilC|nr:type II secretion system F family protein [Synergistaceae bacterium]